MRDATSTPAYTAADRWLEWALLFNFVIHGVALASMALLLAPMLPGGSSLADLERIARIAEHPWRFRLGWLPWHLCALGDLWLALAMVRVRWLSRVGAWFVLVLTCVAVLPDQYAQLVWVTRGVDAARSDPAAYLALERELFPLTSGWAALFYVLAALGWTGCFARAGTWSKLLGWLSVSLWTSMAIAVLAPLSSEPWRPSPGFIAAANAAGFLQMQLWLGLVTEQVLRRFRPLEDHGRLARWRHPGSGLLARASDWVANSRLFGALLEPLPALPMKSDIQDVVYVNYLVPASRIAPLVPQGLELQRLGPEGRYALFTFLTFRHGHFGVAIEPLRKLFPSPVQSNWRIHVVDPQTKRRGIYFVTNAVSSLFHAFGARLLTEGMPMHVFERAVVSRSGGKLEVVLEPGSGSAPDAHLELQSCVGAPPLEGAWAECWPSFREFVAYCVPQDRAFSSQPLRRRVSRQEIDLGIPPDACVPLQGGVRSKAAERLVGDARPLCFHVAAVRFHFRGEYADYRTSPAGERK